MNSDFEFRLPARLLFGWGRRRELGPLSASLGRRAFLVTGSRTLQQRGVFHEIADSLRLAGVEPVALVEQSAEPTVADVDSAVRKIRDFRPGEGDLILAIGGGSALDLGKAVAALACDSQSSTCQDFLEGVGRGLTLRGSVLPLVAVPTTAGTGTEATKNAVISSYDPPFKKSLRADAMLAKIALVDPELTCSAPATVTAWSGMDALTQLIESLISRFAKPMPQALAFAGLKGLPEALETVVRQPNDRPARELVARSALYSGIALANSGLGLAHGVAAGLGALKKTPHGLACATLLPTAMTVNLPVATPTLAEVGRILTGASLGADDDDARAGIERVERLGRTLDIPTRLGELGVETSDLEELVRLSQGNSLSGNPRQLSKDELLAVLEQRL